MDQRVALIRGINVGKAKRVAMADLKALFEALGFTEVKTLLNSGNVVFTVPARKGTKVAERIAEAMDATLGVSAGVIVVDAATWHAVVAANERTPVPDPSRFLVMFPAEPGDLKRLADIDAGDGDPAELQVGEHAAYVWCPGGVLDSKVAANAGKALRNAATARNWATVLKLQALLAG